MSEFVHDVLPSGIEYGVAHLPHRPVVSFQIRVLAGSSSDPEEKLGLARLLAEILDKGTARRSGRELSDALDSIGASYRIGTGRETTTCSCTVLPEHFESAIALHAEFLRTPSFPEDAFAVNLDLAKQELVALEDDAQALTDKLIGRRAFGSPLGRHPLGEMDTLERISREDLLSHWRQNFHGGRMVVSVGGPIEPAMVADVLVRHFGDFGSAERRGRDPYAVTFSAGTYHQVKALEQQQIGLCWPGVDPTHTDFSIQQVMLGVLSGGMSARLFTEVREKQGLVYWVNAWQETPRGCGMIFMGASTTPQRCEQTVSTLLREVDRLAEDIAEEELQRAITGIVSGLETRGDSTAARCNELATDLFYFGRPRSDQEKLEKIKAVTVDDIRRYLRTHPRDRLCVLTLGPKALSDSHTGADDPTMARESA